MVATVSLSLLMLLCLATSQFMTLHRLGTLYLLGGGEWLEPARYRSSDRSVINTRASPQKKKSIVVPFSVSGQHLVQRLVVALHLAGRIEQRVHRHIIERASSEVLERR